MNSLYEISEDFIAAFSAIEVDENGEALDLSALEMLECAFDKKAESIALYVKNLSAMSAQMKAEEINLFDRRKTIENKVGSLKRYLSTCMEYAGKTKLETPRCRISFRSSTAVQIDNTDDLPQEFVKVTQERKPDKTALKEAVKSGREIDGVALAMSWNIQIK